MRNATRRLFVLLFVLIPSAWQSALHAAAPPQPNPVRTVNYDVRDLLASRTGKTGMDSADEVAGLILSNIRPAIWLKNGKGTLQIINDTTLEIAAPLRVHDEIRDFLAALRRAIDVNVRLRCQLVEVPAVTFERDIKPAVKDRPLAVLSERTLRRIAARGTLRRTSTIDIASGKSASALSVLKVANYERAPGDERFGTVTTGLRLRATVSVTDDRRFVEVKLTQNVTELTGMTKRTVRDVINLSDKTIQVPETTTVTVASDVRVDDGETIVMTVAGQPLAGKGKFVLLVRPVIVIEEEERERRKK